MHLTYSKGIIQRSPWLCRKYLYVDLYSACGRYDGCDAGSPLIFIEEAERIGIDYSAIFVDCSKNNLETLETFVPAKAKEKVSYYVGDCKKGAIENLLGEESKENFLGLIYADPNGNPPFASLASVYRLRQYRAVDLLINCPATAIKRDGKSKLSNELEEIKKERWIMRPPLKSSKWQWSFLIGTNWEKMPISKNFFDIETPMGRQAFETINLTGPELKKKNIQPIKLTCDIRSSRQLKLPFCEGRREFASLAV